MADTYEEQKRKKENEDEKESRSIATDAWAKNWYIPLILLTLREWRSYGYELMEKMTAFGLNAMNPGTFYRMLRQMEKDGFVSSCWDTSETGPARRIYSITSAGEAYLKYWAESLNQYQRMMNTFFQLYTQRPPQVRSEEERADSNKTQQ
jgi:PadR family transcriptional regulator PadR